MINTEHSRKSTLLLNYLFQIRENKNDELRKTTLKYH